MYEKKKKERKKERRATKEFERGKHTIWHRVSREGESECRVPGSVSRPIKRPLAYA